MLLAVLHRMKNDATLTSLLGATAQDSRIYPLSVGDFEPSICYADTDIEDSGVVRTSRLELRISAKSYEKVTQIRDRLRELLNIAEDEVGFTYSGVIVMSSTLNGGGVLEFEGADVFQRFMYFDVKWRTA